MDGNILIDRNILIVSHSKRIRKLLYDYFINDNTIDFKLEGHLILSNGLLNFSPNLIFSILSEDMKNSY